MMRTNWRVETMFVQAKAGVSEDIVVATDHLVAVIDGVTDKSGRTYISLDTGSVVTSGRFAAESVARILRVVSADSDPHDIIDQVSYAVGRDVGDAVGGVADNDRPGAVFLAYIPTQRVLFGVGDCQAVWAGTAGTQVLCEEKAIDRLNTEMRAAVNLALRWDGGGKDPGREVIAPLLRNQASFANRPGEWGYGVINGTSVPDVYRTVMTVDADRVVLATDGYPASILTETVMFDEAERRLAELLDIDPLCISQLRGTKAVQPGHASFDDRAWVSVVHDGAMPGRVVRDGDATT